MPVFQPHFYLDFSYITTIALRTAINSTVVKATAAISDPKRLNLRIKDYYLIFEKSLHLHCLQLCYHHLQYSPLFKY
jgi:hypothetical protein